MLLQRKKRLYPSYTGYFRPGKCKSVYSNLDFKSGFLIPLEKKHHRFFLFLGLFHFTVMAQGLKGPPGTFQRVANELIRGLKAIDDIITASHSVAQHFQDTRIENFRMRLTPEKCSFFQTVSYLGVLISKKAPVLAPPILSQPYIFHTNASTFGLGTCLLQKNPSSHQGHPSAADH
ncbi:unnamed protein product [Cylicostephanus goldi]|uniref:Reverse transcriptase domain-containing protein n=1 Tax=Cylicostephanus goldi TaxID=71465 RepID=A0A3P7MCF8_CYLGO|nr:unnamed protein product [Cylicostephanus goldi]